MMRKTLNLNVAGRGTLARLFALALLLFTFGADAFAQSDAGRAAATPAQTNSARAASPVSREAGDLQRLVTEFETANGLKVLVKRREGSQSVVAGLFFRGGSRNVTAENAGVESLMLDVATEASQNFPLEKMRRELARTGTGLSFGINYDYSVLTLQSTRRYFDRSWEVFADSALRPSFAPEDFARVKSRTLISLSDDEDVPDSFLQLLQSRAAYAGHPYANDPRGTVSSVSKLTVEDVRRFHQQAMQTSRLLLVVVGDVDPKEIQRKVEASFGKLPKGDYKPEPPPQLSFAAPTVAVTERAIPTNYISGVYAAPPLTSNDIYPMRVATSILQTRVYEEVRVRRNLSYAPDASLDSRGANTGGIYVTAVDANQAVRVMLDEITRLQTQEITADAIKATAQQFLTRYYLGQETNAAQAGELAQFELIGGGWRNSADVLDRLRAVTPADVKRVANTYMRNLQFVVIGDPRQIDKGVFTHQTGD
jgi:zinc protease